MRPLLIALFLAALQLPKENAKTLEDLEKARLNLNRQTDPVDRVKSQIKISNVLLTLAQDGINKGDLETMGKRLGEYCETIRNAHVIMVDSKRDANKKPGGFKDLEISLRKQLRQLEELDELLSEDRRPPVSRARDLASDIRVDLLRALFGEQDATKNRE